MLSYHSETLFTFNDTVTLTFDPMTSKSIGVIYWSGPTSVKFKGPLVQGMLSYHFDKLFAFMVTEKIEQSW